MGSVLLDLAHNLLLEISKNGGINSLKYSQSISEQHQKVIGAIKSLESLGDVIRVESSSAKCWSCTEEGLRISKDGSHEARLVAWLPKGGLDVDTIKKGFPNANVALGAALKNKWVHKEGALVLPAVAAVTDAVQQHMAALVGGNAAQLTDKQLADYKKRKLVKDSDVTVFTVSKGPNFTLSVSKQEAELTKEMIESGQWKNKTFKPFNFRSKGKSDARAGHLHPLMQLRSEFRQIFLEMGFTEMPTNSFVESAFWNFDALFQPQQHPARDAHDTFYVSNPARALAVPQDYMETVRRVHSEGGYGSSGYRYPWSVEEAHKNLLRTHTTAVSARMLRKLAQDGFRPAKYFSIDRVFRNETLDATHLAEFHQIEGVVADRNLSVKHLIGMFTAFFEKIGIKKLRFKATYNPYTEPSMEIYSYHEGLKKWVEVGNSGLFRPEMLRPMGLPDNVTVLGWGLSLERPAMIMFDSNNIRELVGPRVKMELVYSNPVCTVDKFQESSLLPPSSYPLDALTTTTTTTPRVVTTTCTAEHKLYQRQDASLHQLHALQYRMESMAASMGERLEGAKAAKTKIRSILGPLTGLPPPNTTMEILVTADPRRPPHCLPPLLRLLSRTARTHVLVHTHSSLQELPSNLKDFVNDSNYIGGEDAVVRVRFIWSTANSACSRTSSKVGPASCKAGSGGCVKIGGGGSSITKPASGKSKGPFEGIVRPPRLTVASLSTVEITGENNICRYLARLIELLWEKEQHRQDADQQSPESSSDAGGGPSNGSATDMSGDMPVPLYEGLPLYLVSECDAWLDDCQSWLITGSGRSRANFLNKLSNKLGETEDCGGGLLLPHQRTLADVFVSSCLAVLGRGKVASNVAAWRDRCRQCWGRDMAG